MLILNIGMPRSGTLWRYQIIKDLVIASGGKDGQNIRRQFMLQPFIGSSVASANLNTLKGKRLIPALVPSLFGNDYVLFTHAHPTTTSRRLIQNNRIKAIYGYRDPRDCILSILEYGKVIHPYTSSKLSHLKTLEDTIKYMDYYMSVSEEWINTPNTLFIRYEDMLTNFDEVLEKIIVYLNINLPPQKISQIMETYLPRKSSKEKLGTHLAVGVAHRYKTEFTSEEQVMLLDAFGPVLEKMGYET